MAGSEQPPAWLFSFVDLAFLLLIAMTQIGGDGQDISVELGEIVVPRVHEGSAAELPVQAAARWQLRVHPASEGAQPFELFQPDAASASEPDAATASARRLDPDALHVRLSNLHDAGEEKPLLAPHGESHSQDLLLAASALEEHWPRRRRATVSPVFGRR